MQLIKETEPRQTVKLIYSIHHTAGIGWVPQGHPGNLLWGAKLITIIIIQIKLPICQIHLKVNPIQMR